jgi:hypothetical protein
MSLEVTMRRITLIGPLAGALLLAGLFENNIETSASNQRFADWLASTGHTAWMAHAFAEALAGVLLVGFGQALRWRLAGARDDSALARTVTSMAGLLGGTTVVGAALFAAVPVGAVFESAPAPDPSTYRYLMAAAASVLVIFASVPAAGLAATTALLGLRAGTAPRWLGYTGLALSVLMLASAFVAPLMVFALWLVVTGIGLAVSRPAVTVREPAYAAG